MARWTAHQGDCPVDSRRPGPATLLPSLFPSRALAHPPDSLELFTVRRFVLLVACACLVLIARRPEAIVAPQFFADDGVIFFQQAFQLPWRESLTTTYAGYYHLLPRLVAEACSTLPPTFAPLSYHVVSLLIAAVACCWVWLPHFRHLLPHDAARLGLVAVILLAPNQEALMKLAYVQWYLLLWLILASVASPFRSKWLGGGDNSPWHPRHLDHATELRARADLDRPHPLIPTNSGAAARECPPQQLDRRCAFRGHPTGAWRRK